MTPIAQQVAAVRHALDEMADADGIDLDSLAAAAKTLEFIQAHALGLRILVRRLREHGAEVSEAEREALLAHPAVRDVLAAFPDAMMTVRMTD